MITFIKVPVFWVIIFLAILCAMPSYSEDEEKYDDYNARVYGTIEKMPADGKEGLWIVNDRAIFVTETTEIEEEYGKAAVGAYIEITGNYEGDKFIAYKIEVKMGVKGD